MEWRQKKLDHMMFLLVLLSLFVAPKVLVNDFGNISPSREASVSLAIIPLVIWALIIWGRNKWKRISIIRSVPVYILLFFALYQLIVTALAGRFTPFLMSMQYCIYAFLTAVVLSGYLGSIKQRELQAQTMSHIVLGVAAIVSIGCLVSLYIGPIYPDQVGSVGRQWCGVHVAQGVGFGVNQNTVAGTLIVFIGYALVLCRDNAMIRLGILSTLLLALLSTISRSAILSLFVGLASAAICFCIHAFRSSLNLSLRYIPLMIGTVAIISISTYAYLYSDSHKGYGDSILYGFGLGAYGECSNHGQANNATEAANATEAVNVRMGESINILQLIYNRMRLWVGNISRFNGTSVAEQLLGQGYMGNATIGQNDQGAPVWVTVHNVYLAWFIDFGIFGASLYIMVLVLGLMQSACMAQSVSEGYFGLLVIVALIFHNMTETFFYDIGLLFLLIFLLLLIKIKPISLSDRIHS